MATDHWLGVDLGGTKILAGLFAYGVKPIVRAKQPTPFEEGPAAVVDSVVSLVNRIVTESGIDRAEFRGLGFSVPGQVDHRSGFVTNAPNLSWRNVDLKSLLPADWTWQTLVENDVRAA